MMDRILFRIALFLSSAICTLAVLLSLAALCGCAQQSEYLKPAAKRPPVEDTVVVCDRWGSKLENCRKVARSDLDGYFRP